MKIELCQKWYDIIDHLDTGQAVKHHNSDEIFVVYLHYKYYKCFKCKMSVNQLQKIFERIC